MLEILWLCFFWTQCRQLKTTRSNLMSPQQDLYYDLNALQTSRFLHENGLAYLRATTLAQEWTCPHGQRADLRPSWLAVGHKVSTACPAGELMARDSGKAGENVKTNVPGPDYCT